MNTWYLYTLVHYVNELLFTSRGGVCGEHDNDADDDDDDDNDAAAAADDVDDDDNDDDDDDDNDAAADDDEVVVANRGCEYAYLFYMYWYRY